VTASEKAFSRVEGFIMLGIRKKVNRRDISRTAFKLHGALWSFAHPISRIKGKGINTTSTTDRGLNRPLPKGKDCGSLTVTASGKAFSRVEGFIGKKRKRASLRKDEFFEITP